MKKKIIIIFFLSSAIFANELKWVDEQIEAIKPSRNGIEILNIVDPFIFLDKNRSEIKKDPLNALMPKLSTNPLSSDTNETKVDGNESKKSSFILTAIMNESAMINGNWYKKNDKIKDHTIVDLSKTTVTLKKDKEELLLTTESKIQTIKFKNK